MLAVVTTWRELRGAPNVIGINWLMRSADVIGDCAGDGEAVKHWRMGYR